MKMGENWRSASLIRPSRHFAKNTQIQAIDFYDLFGAPDRIRTCDLCLRRAALYPAELRVPWGGGIAKGREAGNGVRTGERPFRHDRKRPRAFPVRPAHPQAKRPPPPASPAGERGHPPPPPSGFRARRAPPRSPRKAGPPRVAPCSAAGSMSARRATASPPPWPTNPSPFLGIMASW